MLNARILLILALAILVAKRLEAQRTRVTVSGGDISRNGLSRGDATRLAPRIPGLLPEVQARMRVGGDSAQRIALSDFDWRGRVSSVEFDEADARMYWDVKIVPDSTRATIVRYRVDATTGGILDIREFTGVRGLSARRP
jgi:uncharacterized membrane protein YkoI